MEAKMLKIDLTKRTTSVEEIPPKILRQYIGGRGLGSYLLYRAVKPGTDPLGPDNHLIFTAGPANGVGFPFSPKSVVNTRSPLTGFYLWSVSSGMFSYQMRKAGFWAVDISGISDRPVYLAIDDDKVEFLDAASLWGMESLQAQNAMLDGLPKRKAATVAIGPGGENLVRYAAIMADGDTYRAFGRGGAGAVMGSKRLKGIVLSGSHTIQPGDKAGYEVIKQMINKNIKLHSDFLQRRRDFGTGEHTERLSQYGALPTRNWIGGVFEGVERISTDTNKDEWPLKNIACAPHCPAPCSHYAEVGKGPYLGAHCDGPEYETIYAFGSNCGIDKFDAIIAAGQICDEAGIDTITAGLTVSFAMECFERGLLTTKDTDGIELRFGDDKAMLAAVRKIAGKDGFGARLAEGSKRLAAQIPGSESFAMHTKGLEFGGYECRGLMGQALQFSVNARGGCHHGYGIPGLVEAFDGTRMNTEGKGDWVRKLAVGTIQRDSLIICMFQRLVITQDMMPGVLSSLTGEPWTADDFSKAGMRIICQERLFNMREGATRKDDTLPGRLLNEPKPDGPAKGVTVPLELLKDDYYRAMGWDLATGNPTDKALDDLEIER